METNALTATVLDENGNEIAPVEFEERNLSAEDVTALIQDVEANADVIRRLTPVAVSLTEQRHWLDQSGKPMLWGDGPQIIMDAFGISLYNGKVTRDIVGEGDDAHVIVFYHATAYSKKIGKSIQVVGSATGAKKFYAREGRAEADVLSDLVKHAMANCEQRAATKYMGMRHLEWDDLSAMTNGKIRAGGSKAVERKGDTNRAAMTETDEETGLDGEQMKIKIREMILEMCDDDQNAAKLSLKEFTEFKNKDGELVGGRTDVNKLSAKQIPIVYKKCKQQYEMWSSGMDK